LEIFLAGEFPYRIPQKMRTKKTRRKLGFSS